MTRPLRRILVSVLACAGVALLAAAVAVDARDRRAA